MLFLQFVTGTHIPSLVKHFVTLRHVFYIQLAIFNVLILGSGTTLEHWDIEKPFIFACHSYKQINLNGSIIPI